MTDSGKQHDAVGKAPLLAAMRALAVELARHKVRCNSLLPGWTDIELLAGAQHGARQGVGESIRRPASQTG